MRTAKPSPRRSRRCSHDHEQAGQAHRTGHRGRQRASHHLRRPGPRSRGRPDLRARPAGMTGVDVPEVQMSETRLGGRRRKGPIGLPGLSEPEVVRHYVRLSRMNYAIDSGLYPLGSCTMKHNPRLNEKMARLPGFGDIHPLQPQQTVQGAFALISELMRWLTTLTGMPAVAMSPKAGAHGELCGLLAIRAAIEAR